MVKIEPYDFQKKTNIKEHNDLVNKVNEIVTVINDTNLELFSDRLDNVDAEIRTIKNTDSLQWVDIENLKSKDTEQDTTIVEHTNEIGEITESLVSNVTIVDGYNTGTFKVRINRNGTISIDSNEYSLQSPTSIELIQGTGPSMFKCQITLSDGRTLISNDFVFTTEYIGQDVYISSFTFKAGNVDGSISADIGLSSGATIEANNFTIPVQPTVANSINDLNSRVESLENTTVSDARITAIEEKNTEQDTKIQTNTNDIQFMNSEIEAIQTKLSNPIQIVKYGGAVNSMNILTRIFTCAVTLSPMSAYTTPNGYYTYPNKNTSTEYLYIIGNDIFTEYDPVVNSISQTFNYKSVNEQSVIEYFRNELVGKYIYQLRNSQTSSKKLVYPLNSATDQLAIMSEDGKILVTVVYSAPLGQITEVSGATIYTVDNISEITVNRFCDDGVSGGGALRGYYTAVSSIQYPIMRFTTS